jgi:hypothetical protein
VEQQSSTRLQNALARVQRDLDASGVRSRLRIIDAGDPSTYFVALDNGRYWSGGSALAHQGNPDAALWTVAEGVQDLLAEILRTVWPVCADHHRGMHVWPDWAGSDWYVDMGFGTPTWWCKADGGHRVANVGELPPQPAVAVDGHPTSGHSQTES